MAQIETWEGRKEKYEKRGEGLKEKTIISKRDYFCKVNVCV